MKLGAFSVSLTVKDIRKSYEFYKKLGFIDKGGNIEENWVVLKNEECVIGLFQGMFDKNILTFSPGWDQNANVLNEYNDIREIQRNYKGKGIEFIKEADETTKGPEHFIIEDPDGNRIMFDQYV
ncbi:MAG: Glyoxalase-like domain protein [Candidatus Methanofastidiosum methylothiophilum]|uniref:Glyoxalase-like domain protein n=1 Tax=Candidatus Methanofastidiosum methylothiophilum TaxID=1705564 RepID=A0A150IZK4_9EURY|nr:MAG: Glyoxalase-like domain protein [Candidatus Methanofastidiosum methylthiophilus]